MTDKVLFSRSSTEEQVAVAVIASTLGVSIEEATRIFEEEGDTAIGELRASIEEKTAR